MPGEERTIGGKSPGEGGVREIKFRLWDKANKLMVGPKDYWDGPFGAQKKYRKNVVLMQFTGLKDKNGKEIYEGDIVRQGRPESAEVFFRDGSFCTYINKHQWLEMSQNSLEFEVIGNIWEHGHLLNQTTETTNK